jgi:hypothetical protein
VRDHLIALHRNDKRALAELEMRMVWCVMSLKSDLYSKCMLLDKVMFHYWREKNLPAHQMVNQDTRVCNEERGELSLSVLARMLSGDPDRGNIEKLNRLYATINHSMDVSSDFMTDMHVLRLLNDHPEILPTAQEIDTLVVHMRSVIKDILEFKWQHYSPSTTRKYLPTSEKVDNPAAKRLLIESPHKAALKVLNETRDLLLVENDAFGEYVAPHVAEQHIINVSDEDIDPTRTPPGIVPFYDDGVYHTPPGVISVQGDDNIPLEFGEEVAGGGDSDDSVTIG